jgi:hypothetical protein
MLINFGVTCAIKDLIRGAVRFRFHRFMKLVVRKPIVQLHSLRGDLS